MSRFAAVALLSLSASTAAADDAPPRTTVRAAIQSVNVYPDGATVARRGRVALPAGRSTVLFEGLTAGLDEASLKGKVSSGKVTGLAADWQGALESTRETEAKLRAEVERLQWEIQGLNDEFATLQLSRQILEQYRGHAREAIANAAADRGNVSPKWNPALTFTTAEQESIAKAERAARLALEGKNAALRAAQASLQQLASPSEQLRRQVEMEVETDRAGEVEVTLEYRVRDAGWGPAYDVRHDGRGSTMQLVYYGTVWQGTGEDWNDIALTLSTARPTESAQIPTLTSLFLTGYRREKQPVTIVSYGKEAAKKLEAGAGGASGPAGGRATVDDHGTSMVFVIQGKESLPADRRPHKVEITASRLDAAVSYETIPKVAPFVFLKVTATNTTGFPLLAGQVDVFRASGYVGSASLDYVAPQEKITVSLGPDEELRVRRVVDEKSTRAPKLLGTTKVVTQAYEIELSNFKDAPRTVTVVENLPVSQRKEIRVDLKEGTTKPTSRDDDGFVRWNVDLKPGESKKLHFGFEVELPASYQLEGI